MKLTLIQQPDKPNTWLAELTQTELSALGAALIYRLCLGDETQANIINKCMELLPLDAFTHAMATYPSRHQADRILCGFLVAIKQQIVANPTVAKEPVVD